ncbi:GNAT family N-acetyltransferase [Desulfomonile tiedjei]|uniref:Acetyltransferase n=1 Tax=Desulfomonile tiedjei (strain ATCC 49306 / DSM 6799 / DCB-1) TaxID=706587 RepID=I4CB58_DESTA|nr:GNAT family N-acetyltransferase [Desulfomonile tiedjei]AFM26799.1 acetyltransferase [Desulfomonile tiedjei DSM 6799]
MTPGTLAQYLDKLGEPFEAGSCSGTNVSDIIEMYDEFTPKAVTQGLPPANASARHRWVEALFQTGDNFAAWKLGKVAGHSVLIPDLERNDAEYLIFVLGQYQNRGVGTVLTRIAINRAIALGIHQLWLTVEAYNFRAIRMYKNAGFQFCDEGDRERTMLKEL